MSASSSGRTRASSRYVLRELERAARLLSREIESTRRAARARSTAGGATARSRSCSRCSTRVASSRSSDAGASQRLWDLAERWYPETETIPCAKPTPARGEALPRARRAARERRVARAPRRRRRPGSRRVTLALPVRPADPRPRPRRGALRLPLPARDVRPEGEARVRVLRPPVLVGDRLVGRIEPRFDRRTASSRCSARGATPRGPTRGSRACAPGWLEPASVASGRALRDARDPRGAGAGPHDRRDHDARSTRRRRTCRRPRRAQGLRLLALEEPDARRRSRTASRRSRAASTASRSLGARRRRRRHATCSDAGRPRRAVRRRLRRHVPHVRQGLRAKGYGFTFTYVDMTDVEHVRMAASPRRADEARLARDADEPDAEARRHRRPSRRSRTRAARSSSSTTRSRRRTCSSRSSSARTSSCTRRRSTSAATPTSSAALVATNDDAVARASSRSCRIARGGARAVRLLARPARDQDARRAHGAPRENAARDRRVPRAAPARRAVLYPACPCIPATRSPRARCATSAACSRSSLEDEQEAVDLVAPHEDLRRSPRPSAASRASSSTRRA